MSKINILGKVGEDIFFDLCALFKVKCRWVQAHKNSHKLRASGLLSSKDNFAFYDWKYIVRIDWRPCSVIDTVEGGLSRIQYAAIQAHIYLSALAGNTFFNMVTRHGFLSFIYYIIYVVFAQNIVGPFVQGVETALFAYSIPWLNCFFMLSLGW